MLLPDHDDHGRKDTIRVVRDVVEIVAILAAGIWAFYIFIYENRIKPSFSPPNVVLTASLEKSSVHNGTIGVRLKTDLRNAGAVPVYLTGWAVTVVGLSATMTAKPQSTVFEYSGTRENRNTYFALSKPTMVYSTGEITALGSASSGSTVNLQVGQDSARDDTFFVPAGRFDLLRVYVYERHSISGERFIPAALKVDEHRDAFTVTGDDNVSANSYYESGSLDLHS